MTVVPGQLELTNSHRLIRIWLIVNEIRAWLTAAPKLRTWLILHEIWVWPAVAPQRLIVSRQLFENQWNLSLASRSPEKSKKARRNSFWPRKTKKHIVFFWFSRCPIHKIHKRRGETKLFTTKPKNIRGNQNKQKKTRNPKTRNPGTRNQRNPIKSRDARQWRNPKAQGN